MKELWLMNIFLNHYYHMDYNIDKMLLIHNFQYIHYYHQYELLFCILDKN